MNQSKRSRYSLTDNFNRVTVFIDIPDDLRTLIARISNGEDHDLRYLTNRYGKELYALVLNDHPSQLPIRKQDWSTETHTELLHRIAALEALYKKA